MEPWTCRLLCRVDSIYVYFFIAWVWQNMPGSYQSVQIFPDVPDEMASEVIDQVQFALKPAFVAKVPQSAGRCNCCLFLTSFVQNGNEFFFANKLLYYQLWAL